MRRTVSSIAVVAFAALSVLSTAAARECEAPGPAPTVPDGSTATADQMQAAHVAVQNYVNTLQAHQDCLEAKIKSSPAGTKAEVLQKMRDEGNAGIDQAQALSASYAAQVKVFKARTK